MTYNPHKHHRRSIRLKGYDYAQAGLYFITICCQDRAHLFGKIENGEMLLNAYGKIAYEEWKNTENIRNNCRIHEFIIMPNHIHGIIEIILKKRNKGGLQFAPKDGKSESQFAPKDSTGELQFAPTPTKKIKSLDFKIWQRNYYERIIRNKEAYFQIAQYIINNPQKWERDNKSNAERI